MPHTRWSHGKVYFCQCIKFQMYKRLYSGSGNEYCLYLRNVLELFWNDILYRGGIAILSRGVIADHADWPRSHNATYSIA